MQKKYQCIFANAYERASVCLGGTFERKLREPRWTMCLPSVFSICIREMQYRVQPIAARRESCDLIQKEACCNQVQIPHSCSLASLSRQAVLVGQQLPLLQPEVSERRNDWISSKKTPNRPIMVWYQNIRINFHNFPSPIFSLLGSSSIFASLCPWSCCCTGNLAADSRN